MKKYRPDIFLIIARPILDILGVFSAFWIAYYLRSVTDGIPFVQLRIPYISEAQFAPFVFAGIAIWLIIFTRAKLYSHIKRPIFEEIRRVMTYGFFWFFVFIGFVYLTQGFLFFKEIPRLMIFYTLFLATTFSVVFRSILHHLTQKLYQKNFFEKEKILEVENLVEERSEFVKNQIGVYGVSEPCAYLASSRKGSFLVKKVKMEGITISIFEEEM